MLGLTLELKAPQAKPSNQRWGPDGQNGQYQGPSAGMGSRRQCRGWGRLPCHIPQGLCSSQRAEDNGFGAGRLAVQ